MSAGTWYLVIAVLGALNVANGYRPFSRSGGLSVLSLFAGMLTSELPLVAIGVQVVITVGFASAGALGSAAGIAALVVTVLSIVGLLGLHRDAQASRDVLAWALVGGLGVAPGVEDRPTAREIALPNRGGRSRYCKARDVAYGDAGAENQLDIWRRPDLPAEAEAPVLLQIHGGAWVGGKKDHQAGPLLGHLAEHGWVCVTMNYRLSPDATWPDHIVDVKRAIGWVKANIADYGGDPGFVALTGGSSGGHLAALAALSANDPAFQPGFEDVDTSVQAAAPIYGLYDLTNRSGATRRDTIKFMAKKVFKTTVDADAAGWEGASPICRIHGDGPPVFVIHGTNDSFLPVEQARAFVDELRPTSGAPVVFAELPRAQHAFDSLSTVRVHHTVRAIERFLAHVHSSGPGHDRVEDPRPPEGTSHD